MVWGVARRTCTEQVCRYSDLSKYLPEHSDQGAWTGRVPECRVLVSACPQPPRVDNTHVARAGDVATYTCSPGYVADNGNWLLLETL